MKEELKLYQITYVGAKLNSYYKGAKDEKGSPMVYIVAHEDQITSLMSQASDAKEFSRTAVNISIKLLGPVSIDKLTLERLAENYISQHRR